LRVATKREWVNKCKALKHQLERVQGKTELVGDSPSMARVTSRTSSRVTAPVSSTEGKGGRPVSCLASGQSGKPSR